ncbi:MAG TPA: hypothetical protein DFS52_08825 [Myxococcales bacterium]|jgi:transcriptional regulator with XRE-family HTH domain|nr:hypothetical protein [Myxococcales bacterium]
MADAARVAGGAQALAERVGVSRRMIGEYMAGRSDPSRERLVKIADASGVSLEWLAAGRGSMLPGGEQEVRALSINAVPLESIKAWLTDWWNSASSVQRAWLQVEMERHFPEYGEWKKKAPANSNGQCGA